MGNPLHSEPRTGGCLDWFRGCWTAGPLIWTVAAVMAPAMGWAAPFVDVTAFWSIGPSAPLPAGVQMTCSGNAVAGPSGGCSATTTLQTSVTPVPGATTPVDRVEVGGITIANTSGGPLTGSLLLSASISAF